MQNYEKYPMIELFFHFFAFKGIFLVKTGDFRRLQENRGQRTHAVVLSPFWTISSRTIYSNSNVK